jgi:DNA-binding NtrC family response regulator/tetratricopeptide (TPR) repeat protein
MHALAIHAPTLEGPRGFTSFDDRLLEPRPGLVVVHAPPEVHPALAAHAARRLRASGLSPFVGAARAGAPMFREIADALGLEVATADSARFAPTLAQALERSQGVVLGSVPREGSWDFEVLRELAQQKNTFLVLFATEKPSPVLNAKELYELDAELDRDERLRWLVPAAYEASLRIESTNLAALERAWSQARFSSADEPASFDETQTDLLVVLSLVARSVPSAAIGPAGAVDALVASGHLTRSGLRVALAPNPNIDVAALEASATPMQRRKAIDLLLAPAGASASVACPFALARAAELLVAAGETELADQTMAKAVATTRDVHVAREIGARWHAAVAPVVGEAGFFLRHRACERALASGDAHDTQKWADSLLALGPESPEAALLTGLARLQLGDLVAARVSVERALAGTSDGDRDLGSRIAAALAEISYIAGDHTKAREHATRSMDLAATALAKLEGRNVLGKILLAGAHWSAADEHFAEDAITAAQHRHLTSELRARMNRAIAVLSMGRLDDARGLLECVLAESSVDEQPLARSYALRNLAVIAYRQHDYGRALALWDEEISTSLALCGRITMAFTLANFADLRLRLGLTDHAAHTVAFGRRMLTGYVAPRSLANLGIVAARIALERGDMETARREVETARANAEAAGDRGDRIPEAYLCAARVALHDGDVELASSLVDKADVPVPAGAERWRAEVALMRVLTLRAAGRPALDAVKLALAAAREAYEDDILAQVHALFAEIAREGGHLAEAESHYRSAIRLRDRVADGLPPAIRSAFLAKAENVALSNLFASFSDPVSARECVPAAPRPATQRASTRWVVGDDPAMRKLAVSVKRVARSNATVLVQGESGTGKELVAEALHQHSSRAKGPFLSVNCAALVEGLLLSELFGHEKGSFTGASGRKLGRFELAKGGTLFLDEIGDISPRTQVALLRVLQEKTFERVGGTTPIRADVRVVCATHRDLRVMVERGEFREDLYYRIQGITLEVPPLRHRLRDLPEIVQHLLARVAEERDEAPRALSSDALALLKRYAWPGNVRELENVLRAVALFAEGPEVTVADLVENVPSLRAIARGASLAVLAPSPTPSSPSAEWADSPASEVVERAAPSSATVSPALAVYSHVRAGAVSLAALKREIERECITRALDETNGNITHAAALLGMKRPRLSQLAKEYNLKSISEDV